MCTCQWNACTFILAYIYILIGYMDILEASEYIPAEVVDLLDVAKQTVHLKRG